jgi:hypothetical protein
MRLAGYPTKRGARTVQRASPGYMEQILARFYHVTLETTREDIP